MDEGKSIEDRIAALERRERKARGRAAATQALLEVITITLDLSVYRDPADQGQGSKLVTGQAKSIVEKWDMPDDVREQALATIDEVANFTHGGPPADGPATAE